MDITGLTIGDLLRRNATDPAVKGRCALIYGDERVTYGELNERVNHLANGFLVRGVEPGDRVAVLGRNSITYVVLYFALAKAGAIMVPINFWYREAEIAFALNQSGARLLIVQSRFADVGLSAADQADRPDLLVYDGQPDGFHSLQEVADASDEEPDAGVEADDPHIILYTSGTTGFPKGATFTHRAHVAHAHMLAESTHGEADDVGAIIYPLFHTGGPDCLLLPHVVRGATLVILDGGDPDAVLDAVETHRITNIYCVPTVWRWILERQRKRAIDVSSVRRCLGSSDTFPPDLLDGILSTFDAEVYVTYGLTEAGCILTVCHLNRDDRSRLDSIGRPIPSIELRLVDEDNAEVRTGKVGEIIARTPGVMSHYWDLPERTEETLRGGWLYTGDLARRDSEGYFYMAGRSKDVIISGGENIYPLEIERLIKENSSVKDVAVVGVPDSEWGESVLAVVVPTEGSSLTGEEVTDFVRDRAAGFKRPRYVEIVEELPVTTATGKVQKKVLRDRYREKYARRSSQA